MRVLVVGAQGQGRLLAHELVHDGHQVRVLDEREARLAQLPADLALQGIRGSALDRNTLAGALDGCDAVATATGDDALNAVVALAARRELRVPLAAAIIEAPARAQALVGLGVHIVCPTARTSRDLRLILVRSGIEDELPLGGELGVYRADVPVRLAGRTMRDVERAGKVLPIAVERDGRARLAVPELELRAGDVLHVAAARRDDVEDLVRP